jgi:hypothetical protein
MKPPSGGFSFELLGTVRDFTVIDGGMSNKRTGKSALAMRA